METQDDRLYFAPGSILFSCGDQSDCAYFIHSGKVGIYGTNLWRSEKPLRIFEDNCIVGEMGLIENKPRSATAVVLEGVQVTILRKEQFSYLSQTHKQFFVTLLKALVNRLRHTLKLLRNKPKKNDWLIKSK